MGCGSRLRTRCQWLDLGVERSLRRPRASSLAMRIFSSNTAADDDGDVDDLAAGHGATRKRHVAAAGEFFSVL